MSDDDDYVGYRHPPKSGRFRKGQSGNPAGRRAERDRFADVLREELAQEITLKVGDRKETVTVLRGLTKMLINLAIAGNHKAFGELIRQINRYMPDPPEAADTSLPPSEEDLELLEDYMRRRLLDGSEGGRRDKSE